MQNVVRVLAFASLALLMAVTAIGFQAPQSYESEMFRFPVLDDRGRELSPAGAIPQTKATLFTTSDDAIMTIDTQELTPGDAVTMWWIIFNYPEFCSDRVCGEDDVLPAPGNLDAGVAVLLGDGSVVAQDGTAFFWDVLDVGDTEGIVFGPGLTNPQGAEYHYVLRSHGQARDEVLYEQLHSINGGCDPEPPNAPCYDVQFAVFKQNQQ